MNLLITVGERFTLLSACSRRRMSGTTTTLAIAMLVCSASVFAQSSSPVFDATGIQPQHDQFSQLPFEHVDTATGGVVLTFTDLVLPGDAGSELRFVRSYNSKTDRWTFGLAGLMFGLSDAWGTGNPEPPNPSWGTVDGGEHVGATALTSDFRVVMDDRFWVLERDSKNLYGPDGSVSHFRSDGRLDTHYDAYGNPTTATFSTDTYGILSVVYTQYIAGVAARSVTVRYGACGGGGCEPSSLEYDGRTWQYVWDSNAIELIEARPPSGGGPSWFYDDDIAGVGLTVTTPTGGRVRYHFHEEFWSTDNPPTSYTTRVVDSRQMFDRGATDGPTWTFTYDFSSPETIVHTYAHAPDGTTTTFEYGSQGDTLIDYLVRRFILTNRTVAAANGTVVETEHRDYADLPVFSGDPGGIPELKTSVIERPQDGMRYTTAYDYRAVNGVYQDLGDYHTPDAITETSRVIASGEEHTRTTQRTFVHLSAPGPSRFILDKPTSEAVSISDFPGGPIARQWGYDGTTGFNTTETVAGLTTTHTPDAFGNLASTTTPDGVVTTLEHVLGQVSNITTPAHVTSREVNADGTVRTETEGYGSLNARTTTFGYDAFSRLTSVQPPGTSESPTVTDYTCGGGTCVTTTRAASSSTTTLDGFARPIHTVNSVGIATDTAYDSMGRVAFQSVPHTGTSGTGTQFDYDALGRVIRETHTADGTYRSYAYAGPTVTVTDEQGRPTAITHRAFGNPDDSEVTALRDAAGGQWNYMYDAANNLRQVAGPDGVTRTWVYNSNNLLQSETHPESGTASYTYAGGKLRTKTDANGVTLTYDYDSAGRLHSISGGDRPMTIDYENGSDRRSATTAGGVSSQFAYDGTGRLAQRTDTVDGKSFPTTYTYDGSDNVLLVTYASGRHVQYGHDSENRITKVFNADTTGNYASSFQYDPSGALAYYVAGNGVPTTITYDSRQRVSAIAVTASGGSLGLTYGYDNVGNVTSIADARGGSNSQTFGYDSLDRLTSASGPYGANSFTYDANGNRLMSGNNAYTYIPGKFQVQSFMNMTFGYDNNGNMTSAPNSTYTYTADNLMRQVTTNGTTMVASYDADDWRIKKTITTSAGTETHYYLRGPNNQLLTDWLNGTSTADVRDYIYAGSRLIAVTKSTTLAR